jgi:hypothetical protein
MTVLEARKRLLIAESELSRAQLAQEWRTMAEGVHSISSRARSISSLALVATSLISGLASGRRIKSAPVAEKRSWWQTLLKGARLGWSLWIALSPPRPKS